MARTAELLPESRETVVHQSSTAGSGKTISVTSPHGTSPDKTRGMAEGIARKQSRAPASAEENCCSLPPTRVQQCPVRCERGLWQTWYEKPWIVNEKNISKQEIGLTTDFSFWLPLLLQHAWGVEETAEERPYPLAKSSQAKSCGNSVWADPCQGGSRGSEGAWVLPIMGCQSWDDTLIY